MKISPIAQSSGQPGETLTSTNVGRTADPGKMARATAIARGETPPAPDAQVERIQQNARKLKMRTNFSTNRDAPLLTESTETVNADPAINANDPAGLSPTGDDTEQGTVEVTQPLSPQFAALAKQKRAFQLEKAEFEKQRATLESGGTKSLDEYKARLKSDTMSVLQENGLLDTPEFYNSVSERMLSGEAFNPDIAELKAKIAALEQGIDNKFQTRETQAEEAALTEMLSEAEALAKEGEDYALVRENDAYDQVLRLIHDTYKKTGKVLDVSFAMNSVENKLMAQAEKLAGISKVRNKLAPPAPPPAPLAPQRSGMRTLTARDTAAPVSDRRARALAAFAGTLKR